MKPLLTGLKLATLFVRCRAILQRAGLLSCLLWPLLGLAQPGQAEPTNGLVAYYPFDGSANDASANDHNPIVDGVHNVTWTTNRFGRADSAAAFDGTAWIDYGDVPELGFNNTSFSVSCWLKADVQDSFIIGKTDLGRGQGWGIQCENTDVDGVGVRLDLGDGVIGAPDVITTGPSVFGSWRHVCLVVNRELQTATAYLDGVPTASLNISQFGSLANATSVKIGDRGDNWFRLSGQLDEVRIYNRAVTGVEVGQLFGGLAAYYPFDGNANDASGNGNDPLAINGATWGPDRSGGATHAVVFDGNSDIDYGPNALPDTGKTSFSVSLWVRADVQDAYVLGKPPVAGAADPGPYWSIQAENTPEDGLGLRLDLSDGVHFSAVGPAAVTTGPGVFGGWHHVCMVIDRWQQTATAYLDGAKKGSNDISAIGSVSNANDLRMGWRGDWARLNGSLDEVFIYNRVLTDAEVYELASEPRLSIEVSQVRLCWNARVNKTYQVQYRSTLTGNAWVDLGNPILGNGSTQCLTDDVAGPQRFYRAVLRP